MIDAPGDNPEISNAALLAALKAADDAHLAQGMEPAARHLMNVGVALGHFGIQGILMGPGAPAIAARANRMCDLLFVPQELQSGGMHLGAFLFRDMFVALYAPIIFGTAHFDPWTTVDLNPVQKGWLADSAEEVGRFFDQAADIMDFGYGWQEFGDARSVPDLAKDLIWRAHAQLEAAAATATRAFDYRGTVQAALLGAELALKAGLAAHGLTDKELGQRALGHNYIALAERLATFEAGFDLTRVSHAAAAFPNFVQSRYNTPAPLRVETGHILMGAQYIASEVTRLFTDRNIRRNAANPHPRTYPQ